MYRITGITTSLLLIAAGAILAWGVTVHHTNGFNVNTIGIILFVVGVVGLIVSIAASALANEHRTNTYVSNTDRIVEPPVTRERVVEAPPARERIVERERF